MLASWILPFNLTLIVCAITVIVIIKVLLAYKKSWLFSASISLLISSIMFFPLIYGISSIVDHIRYGKFEYKTSAEISDINVEIPDSSKNIKLHKFESGHAVTFSISEKDLMLWLKYIEKKRSKFDDNTSFVFKGVFKSEFDLIFSRYNWISPGDTKLFKGWRAGNGAGYDVWYSPSLSTGFIVAAYW